MSKPRIKLISFGPLKTPGLAETVQHFSKLISRYGELSELELTPARRNSERSKNELDVTRKLDTQTLIEALAKLKPGTKIVILDERGKARSSLQWAKIFEYPYIALCVGPATGWHPGVVEKIPNALIVGLGAQTVSHELAHVVVLEQAFRALAICHHHPYHCA